LAKLKRELIGPSSGSGGGGGGIGFDVARYSLILMEPSSFLNHQTVSTGVASVGFVGFPSVGKVCIAIFDTIIPIYKDKQSTLMSKLTGTHSEVSEIDFTTLTTVPGTLKVHGAPIQILDLRVFHI